MTALDSSDSSIKQQINYLIQVEEGLLDQCRSLRRMTTYATGQLITAGLSEGAKAIATDLFSSALAGRYAKRFH
jgi:hypothetical protein